MAKSDDGIFSHSNLSRQLENGTFNVILEKLLLGTDITLPYVLEDEGYSLKFYLMWPYLQRNKYLNKHFSMIICPMQGNGWMCIWHQE
jgi:hypothetical protein